MQKNIQSNYKNELFGVGNKTLKIGFKTKNTEGILLEALVMW